MKNSISRFILAPFVFTSLVIGTLSWGSSVPASSNSKSSSGEGLVNPSIVPGRIIAHSPAASKKFIGSVSLAVLPDGSYVASHDFFGPASDERTHAITNVYRSVDKGESWEKVAEFNQFWGGLFVHNGALYILSPRNNNGDLVIRKSTDGGKTWSEPKDEKSGLLLRSNKQNGYHTAPCAVIVANGRIWRAIEAVDNTPVWPKLKFRAFVMSAPEDSDLLDADSWTYTNSIAFPELAAGFAHWTWLEGNMIKRESDGQIFNMMRVEGKTDDMAAMLRVSSDGKSLEFNLDDFARLPGANKKFVPRYDPISKKYWTLSNYIPEEYRTSRAPAACRNVLALMESKDLKTWRLNSILIKSGDVKHDGYQYTDWLFDGDDIIFVCRTACFDGISKAKNHHDSNFMTFHRIKNFRQRNADSPLLNIGKP